MFKVSLAFLFLINTVEACQCFANDENYEPLCEESKNSGNVDWCMSHEECHWGPTENAECKIEETSSETSKCHCIANEAVDVELCEQGENAKDKLLCLSQEKCLWGPEENEWCGAAKAITPPPEALNKVDCYSNNGVIDCNELTY